LKIKHYILFICLFAVIVTKTYVVLYTLFSDYEIELSNELDEEDSDNEEDTEEDTEKETSEKDIYIYQSNNSNQDFFNKKNDKKNNYLYCSTAYSTPYLDNIFCPPDFLS
jgi:hypothetical protein